MKVLALLLFVSVVSARPESGWHRLRRDVKEGKSLETLASLPLATKRIPKQRESYTEYGAEIPVHLIYEEGDETEAVVKEVTNSKDPMLNRVAREPIHRRTQDYRTFLQRRQRSLWSNPLSGGYSAKQARRSRRAIQHGEVEPMYAGPRIVKLKVRRGGVAIAGPGGVATAGSGGTAIVGPGGTAYTTPDGTAVVGPGGRLIHLGSPYTTKGRASPRIIATGPLVYYPMQL